MEEQMKIEIGRSVNGGPVYLTEADFLTHLHVQGLSRSGKSFWLLYLIRELIRWRKSFCLLDPHGSLYRDVLAHIVAYSIGRPVVLFDPSYEQRIVGFNPFITEYTDEARKMTKAERLGQQLMKVFGLENSDQFGNIERLLRALFFVLLDRELSICDLKYFLY
jgi:hypothetical protein